MKQIVLNIPDSKYAAFIEFVKSRFSDIQIKEKPVLQRKSKNLSGKFRNKIPKEISEEMHRQLSQMRAEWERDI